MQKIAVIGSGTMGNGIAHVFAQKGFTVSLIDISEEALKKAINTIDKNLSRQIEKGTITADVKNQTLSNLTTTTFLKEGIKDADLVV
ncbi:MAG: 3-hydroxyacyl-CoA dehydrogenase NAD-binding domain-containing protein, partial [Flammeovirgaceae bacterium]